MYTIVHDGRDSFVIPADRFNEWKAHLGAPLTDDASETPSWARALEDEEVIVFATYAAGPPDAVITERPQPDPGPMTKEDIADLDARMEAAGMYPLSKILAGETAMGPWLAHRGVTDPSSFEAWMTRRHGEILHMKVRYDLDNLDKGDELLEWICGHAGAYAEVTANWRAAKGTPDALVISLEPDERDVLLALVDGMKPDDPRRQGLLDKLDPESRKDAS